MKKSLLFALILGLFFIVSDAYACHPWINVNKYNLKTNDIMRFHIAYGHRYPFGHSFYNNELINDFYIINPVGKKEKQGPRVLGKGKYSQVQFESKEDLQEGTYLVVMESQGNFGAYTNKGYKRKSKKDLRGETIKGDVKFSQNFCKAIVNVGEKSNGENYSKILGHGLEIVPLKDPGQLRVNDVLPLNVLHNGKIVKDESIMVYATYMGFSNEPDAFAYTSWASKYNNGIAKIRLLQPGTWMLFVNHKLPYPNTNIADKYSYQATLTFEIKP